MDRIVNSFYAKLAACAAVGAITVWGAHARATGGGEAAAGSGAAGAEGHTNKQWCDPLRHPRCECDPTGDRNCEVISFAWAGSERSCDPKVDELCFTRYRIRPDL